MSGSTNDPPHERSGAAEPTDSDRHRLPSNGLRSAIHDVLEGRATPVQLDDVAAAIVEREATSGDSASARREDVAIALHHKHLPQMTATGVIEYDPETHTIRTV